LKILRVANVPDNRTGGVARVMYETGDRLAAMGHQVDYLFSSAIRRGRSRLAGRFLVPWRISRLIAETNRKQGPYDVVEIHEPLSLWCALRQRWSRRYPAVAALSHGLEQRGHSANLAYRRLKRQPISMRNRFSPLTVVWQAVLGLRFSSAVLCLNEEDRAHLLAGGVPDGRIHVIPNGTDEIFLRVGEAAVDPARAGHFLFLATWLERKGILDLVPAIIEIFNRRPACRLTVAGCQVDADVVRGAFPAELRDRIEVIPKIDSDEELIAIYRRHQILLLPSVFEGMPLVMLEAAAMKMAVITTPRCGMRDFIHDGVNGLLIPPGAPEQLAAAMLRLVDDPALADRLGEAAHRSAREWTWDRTALALLAAYEGAIRNRRGTPNA